MGHVLVSCLRQDISLPPFFSAPLSPQQKLNDLPGDLASAEIPKTRSPRLRPPLRCLASALQHTEIRGFTGPPLWPAKRRPVLGGDVTAAFHHKLVSHAVSLPAKSYCCLCVYFFIFPFQEKAAVIAVYTSFPRYHCSLQCFLFTSRVLIS